MPCNQFLAPNGEPSLLYAALEQKYGPDRATQLWNLSKQENFSGKGLPVQVQPQDALEEKMLNFLGKLNIDTREFDSLKELTGYDAVGATDLLNKVINVVRNRNETVLPKETAYVAYSMLGKKNKIRTDLIHSISSIDNYQQIFDDYKKRSPNLTDGKIKELITVDYLADAIHNNYAHPKESYTHRQSDFWQIKGDSAAAKQMNYLLQKIKNFLNELFNNSRLDKAGYDNLVNDMANDILTGNMDKYQTELHPDQQLTNYNAVVNSDPKAKGIIDNFQKMGFTLTGSLSLRRQGTLFRTANENLHDLDFTVQNHVVYGDMAKAIQQLHNDMQGASEAGKAALQVAFTRNLNKLLQKQSWFNKIKSVYPEFEITNSFSGQERGMITLSGKIGEHAIDLFVQSSAGNGLLDNNTPGFQDWQNVFKAKLQMGRAKDMLDFIHYKPFEMTGGNAQESGLRHFNFDRTARVDKNGELTMSTVEQLSGIVNRSINVNPTEGSTEEVPLSRFRNHSGGAAGADEAWDQIGRQFGFTNHTHYREPGKDTVDSATLRQQGIKATPLDAQTYAEGKSMADLIDKFIGENPNRAYGHYRYRNYGQVKNADAVFAISSGLGIREKSPTKSFMPLDRGTIYAIVGAVLENKPVYVFDQKVSKWYTYNKETKGFQEYNQTPVLTPNFAGVGSRNLLPSGKEAIRSVYEATLNQSGTAESAAQEKDGPQTINVSPARFRTGSADELVKSIDEVYQEARANPLNSYTIPFTGEEKLRIGKANLTTSQLANMLDREDTPSNVSFTGPMFAKMQNLPKRWLQNVAMESPNPLQLDQGSVTRQMDKVFLQIRDSAKQPTGQYFSLEKQNQTVDSVIGLFASAISTIPIGQQINVNKARDQVFTTLNRARKAWIEVNEGRSQKMAASADSAQKILDYTAIINSFHIPGQDNTIWNFAMAKLQSQGITVAANGVLKDTNEHPESMPLYTDPAQILQMEEGTGLQDYSDSSFEMDMKDTASSRMKLFLIATEQTHFEDEQQPTQINLAVTSPETRKDILAGIKKDLILPKDRAAELGIQAVDQLDSKLSAEGRKAASQRTALIDGKLMRVTAARTITSDLLSQSDGQESVAERIGRQEGINAQEGDLHLELTPYQQEKDMLVADKNFLGLKQLADFESLFQDLSGLLNTRKPDFTSYLTAMKESSNPNIRQVAVRLQKASEHIQKEFTSVMSSHYQRQLMVLFKRTFDGHLQARVIDSNRTSELETIKRFWQEAQKIAPILSKDASGQTVVNHSIAMGLYDQLQEIYNIQPPAQYTSKEMSQMARNTDNKQAQRRYEQRGKEIREVQKEVSRRKLELFHRVMAANGIELDAKAVQNLFDEKKYSQMAKGTSLSSLYAGFTQEGKPIGLMDTLIHRLAIASDEGENVGEDEDLHQAYKAHNPLYIEGTAINILAKSQLPYTKSIYSNTHKSADGKTIHSYGLNTALSHAVRQLKEDPIYRDRYQDSHFAKRSWLLDRINNETKRADRFQLTYMDGLKNEYGSRDGVTRTNMSDREQQLMALSLFQNRNNIFSGHYVSMTHSDKTKTPVYMNGPKIQKVMGMQGNKIRLRDATVELIYHHAFMAEYDRMMQPGGEQIKGYAQGKKFYYFLPRFNYTEMTRLIKEGKLTEADRSALWLSPSTPQSVEHPNFKETAIKLIHLQLVDMINETKASWNKSGLLENNILPGSKEYYTRLLNQAGFHQEQVESGSYAEHVANATGTTASSDSIMKSKWTLGSDTYTGTKIHDIAIHLAAADYAVNSFLFNTSLSQLFYGDPAYAFKNNVPDTLTEYSKRLAKDIAPFRDGDWSHSPTYVAVTAMDYQPIAKELAGVKGYEKGVDATDAQELITTLEHLNVMYGYGKITRTQLDQAKGLVRDAKGGFYTFTGVLHDLIMQPMKPLASGLRNAQEGTMRYDYVKSSAFPLYPPLIQDMELDKLRRGMETTGVDRLNFNTAKKLGAPVDAVRLFSSDGRIDENLFKSASWMTGGRQDMDRANFGIQQEVPYDEDKDSILTLSQMNKNIVEKIATITTPFKYQGQEVNGANLRKIKEDIRQKMLADQVGEFLQSIGATRTDAGYRFTDKSKLYDFLASEAGKEGTGYTINDVMAITSFQEGGRELTIPILFTPSAAKFESSLMSLIQKVVKVKMPGKSFIQASPAGFQSMQTWESAKLDQNSIVWTKPLQGELKTAHPKDGQTQPAQVLVGFNYFSTASGGRLNIEDYTTLVDGKKMLDTAKIPPELFQLIGARIPNQGHSSMLPIEIIGFLPQEMGDMIVVPAAITKQMGADFDVDKLYTYHRAYTQDGERLASATDDKSKLQNDYFDVHWSVLTHPDMFDAMMSPLDKNDAKEEAALLNPPSAMPYYFGPDHQLSDFQSMKGAKVLVGMTALSMSNNAIVQNGNLQLVSWQTGEDGKVKKIADPIEVLDENGDPLALSHASGYGQSTYKGQIRSKSDNIQIQESESVDHPKNRVIDKLNLNPYTAGASLAMSRLQSADEGTPGEVGFTPGRALSFDYNARLLMQPIIQEYAAEMSKANDTLSTSYSSNVRDKVMNALEDKYRTLANKGIDFASMTEEQYKIAEEQVDSAISRMYSAKDMLESIQSQDKPDRAWYLKQIAMLDLFRQFDDVGKLLTTMQSVMNGDTRGAGGDMLTALYTADKRSKLGTAAAGREIDGVEELFMGTEAGMVYNYTTDMATKLYANDLPYEKMVPLYTRMAEEAGRIELTAENKKLVFNAMKSFVFASKELGLFTNAAAERARLMFNQAGPSLARRLEVAKNTPWGKNNYFLQRLQSNIDPDGINPETIQYNATKASRTDDYENSTAWLSLLNSEDPQVKTLGEDLLRYSYATGGLQSTRNFIKFTPWAAIEGSSIAPGIRERTTDLRTLSMDANLQEQLIQHNPIMAKQLSTDLKEIGKPEQAPDTFSLPRISAEMGDHPAKSLVITLKEGDGSTREDYPQYVSYRKGSKWLLYKRRSLDDTGHFYSRIDTLGAKDGTLEYNGIAEGETRSIYAENRTTWQDNMSSSNYMLSNKAFDFSRTSVAQANTMLQIGLTSDKGGIQEVEGALKFISTDPTQPAALRTVAETISGLQRNPVEFALFSYVFGIRSGYRFETVYQLGSGVTGVYNTGRNLLQLSKIGLSNKQIAAETLVHEQLHYHTALMAMAMETPEQWAARGLNSLTINRLQMAKTFIEGHPEILERLQSVQQIQQDVFSKFKRMVTIKKGEEYWNTQTAKNQGDYGQLHYALNNITEFIPGVLSSPEVMHFLNGMQYMGPKSMLTRITEAIAQFWGKIMEAFGARPGSYLEEAARRVLDVVTYSQAANFGQQNSNNTGDMGPVYNELRNKSIVTSEITTVDRILGKLNEQLASMRGSYTGVLDARQKANKRMKIDKLKEQIQNLAATKDLAIVNEIGKTHLKWVAEVAGKSGATANEIRTATNISEMWRGILELTYGGEAESRDPELAQLADQAGNLTQKLLTQTKDYITKQADGAIRQEDWQDKNLVDVGWIASRIRSLSSAATSRVTQHIAGYVETTSRQQQEDIYRLNEELNILQEKMSKYGAGKLDRVYAKLMQSGEDSFGLAMQYSQKWFDWKQTTIARRNAQLSNIDKGSDDLISKNRAKRVVWESYWKDVNKTAAFVDTNIFFEPETGQYKQNIQEAKDALAKQVGTDHVDTLLSRAQERYLKYVDERTAYYNSLDDAVATKDKTAEEAEADKVEYANRHSPNVFFQQKNNARSNIAASDRYVTMAPLAANEQYWNPDYQKMKDDKELAPLYNEYSAIMERLLSYLPKHIQESAGAGFLPAIRKAVMTEGLNIPEWIKTYQERQIKSLTATGWQEQMNDRAYNSIPVDYVNAKEVPIQDRSRDLIGLARMFGSMALHYKHFSSARDVIEMGQSILKEIERTRADGSAQVEQNGRVVTIKQGLRNSIDALEYLKKYSMYNKPKALEFSIGKKLYAEKTATGQKFTLNPFKQRQMSRTVRKLTIEMENLQKQYTEQTDEHPMSLDKYIKERDRIAAELSKYEGMTLYGSKAGDKLIGVNQLKTLSYNPFSAVANIGFGLITVTIHANGGRDFTHAESYKAFKLMLNSTKKSLGVNNAMAEKIVNIMDRLGVIGDYVDSKIGRAPTVRDNRPTWKQYLDPFAMMRSTDYFMKGVTTVAHLLHRQVEVTEVATGEKKTISMWDALNKDGQWDAEKYGENRSIYSPDDVTEQKQWDKLRNHVVRMNMVLHGNQDHNAPKMVNENILGRLIGQFRMSWLPEGFYNRFQKEHYDEYLDRQVKGRYTTISELGLGATLTIMGKQLLNLIPGVHRDITTGLDRPLSEVDTENMRRNFAEIGWLLTITAAVMMLRHLNSDPDKDKKNRIIQMLINQLIRNQQDINFYVSPQVFDTVTRNIVPATQVLTDYMKLVKATGQILTDDDYTYDKWLLKVTKAGLPIPQATLINKTKFAMEKDLGDIQQ